MLMFAETGEMRKRALPNFRLARNRKREVAAFGRP
jgi:hypothetical protein